MNLKNEIAISASDGAACAQEIIDSLLSSRETLVSENVYAFASVLGLAISAHMTLLALVEASEKLIDIDRN